MSMTSASGTGAGVAGAGGAARLAAATAAAGGGRRGAGASQFAPFGVGLAGLIEQGQVAEQHDGRRHDHPPGGHPGVREHAGRDGQAPAACRAAAAARTAPSCAPGPAARRGKPPPASPPGSPPEAPAGPALAAPPPPAPPWALHGAPDAPHALGAAGYVTRAGCASRPGASSRRRSGGAVASATSAFRLRYQRGDILAVPPASRVISPKPPGNEHASPDGDDGDVEYRAAQQSSPRRGRRRACSSDAK